MAITTIQLRQLLNDCSDVQVFDAESDEFVGFTVTASIGDPILVLASIRNGELVQFRTIGLLTATSSNYRPTLLRALVDLNYRYKMIKFSFDDSDGEVSASVPLLVMDSTLTVKQVERVVSVIRTIVPIGKGRCEHILQSGTDTTSPDDELNLAIAAMSKTKSPQMGSPSGPKPQANPSSNARRRGLSGLLDSE